MQTLDNLCSATTAPWQNSHLQNWSASTKRQRYILNFKCFSAMIINCTYCRSGFKFTPIGLLHDLVTWYRINYTGTQVMQWDFQNKGTRTSPAQLSFVLEVPLHNLSPSVIYSVPCDRIMQRAYSNHFSMPTIATLGLV